MNAQLALKFDGSTYKAERDGARLNGQMKRVLKVLQSGESYTLNQIAILADVPLSTVGSRVRDFRKEQFGKLDVRSKNIGGGTWIYWLVK